MLQIRKNEIPFYEVINDIVNFPGVRCVMNFHKVNFKRFTALIAANKINGVEIQGIEVLRILTDNTRVDYLQRIGLINSFKVKPFIG